MQLRSLAVASCAALIALIALPGAASAQTTRQVLKGDSIAIYNLVGELHVEPGTGNDVAVEIRRGGADAEKLEIQTGPLRGRETLRVIYPDDVIVLPDWGRGWSTTLRVRDDGTFSDGGEWRDRGYRGYRGYRDSREVRITGRGRRGGGGGGGGGSRHSPICASPFPPARASRCTWGSERHSCRTSMARSACTSPPRTSPSTARAAHCASKPARVTWTCATPRAT